MIRLYEHQQKAIDETKHHNKVAYYLDMGLGKTFVGSEKMNELGAKVNLVICQKSKIDDWIEHFETNYNIRPLNYTQVHKGWVDDGFVKNCEDRDRPFIIVINYELAFRRPELLKLKDFTLLLDESSMIQNEKAKRSKFILKMNPENVILLSGTPTGGKYEKLYSQLKLLGMKLSKTAFWNTYVNYKVDKSQGFPLVKIFGYKNVERLKRKMRQYGCVFMKTEEVFDLPDQVEQVIKIPITKEYRKFRKDSIVELGRTDFMEFQEKGNIELVGDTTLTKMLYERQLCGQYNTYKLKAFEDLLESTNDRLIVFYNFNQELEALKGICDASERPYSIVNGQVKDLSSYEEKMDSVTFIQYQAGAMGLNLQKANKIIYFTPPLSSELFEQSKARTHRIGQERTCFYYYLTCKGSVEEKIYEALAERRDYTERLFENE